MKRCSQCKQIKPLSEFNKDRSKKDGLQNCCKSCRKAYEQAYQQTEKGKAVNHKANAKYQLTPKGKARMKRFYARNPNYRKATHAVNHAIRDGSLPHHDTRQCHYCPAQAQEYHHWHGYEPKFWLDVIPVCKKCHSKCN